MSDDTSEYLWSTVYIRNQIMNVAEAIAPKYKLRHIDEDDHFPRYISVKNVEFEYKQIGEIFQFDTDIEFLSDIGSWTQSVIIRQFYSKHQFDLELSQYYDLEKRCLIYQNINPLPIIHIDKDELMIAYEASEGVPITSTGVPNELINFQYGVLAAILHGEFVEKINVDQTKNMILYFLKILPLNETTKKNVLKSMDKYLKVMVESNGGYNPVTVFDPKLFRVVPLKDINHLTKYDILNNHGFLIDIEFQQTQEIVEDRMVDISSCFGKSAYIEFLEQGSLKKTIGKILEFIEGYDLLLENYYSLNLEHLYPNGLTLDIQMLIAFWLLYYRSNELPEDTVNLHLFTNYILSRDIFRMNNNENFETKSKEEKDTVA